MLRLQWGDTSGYTANFLPRVPIPATYSQMTRSIRNMLMLIFPEAAVASYVPFHRLSRCYGALVQKLFLSHCNNGLWVRRFDANIFDRFDWSTKITNHFSHFLIHLFIRMIWMMNDTIWSLELQYSKLRLPIWSKTSADMSESLSFFLYRTFGRNQSFFRSVKLDFGYLTYVSPVDALLVLL